MKKLLLLAITLSSILTSYAQIHFGIKAGYNLSDLVISGNNLIGATKAKSQFNGGLFSSINLSKSFLLQPEIVYSREGATIKDTNYSGTLNYNYINIPILLKYQHESGLFVETGPQFGFVMSATYVSDGGGSSDQNSAIKSTVFAWVAGLGYKIPDINLGIDVRYNFGISNIENRNLFTVRNNVFQIDLFYVFK